MEYINCHLCDSDNTKTLFRGSLSSIVQCKGCGLVYKNPRPCQDEMIDRVSSDEVVIEHKKAVWYDSKVKLFKRNLKRIERYSPKGRLLDIGCGYGTFLRLAKDNGWDVAGVEIAYSACKYAREALGLEIHSRPLGECGLPENYFDVVTLWDVLSCFCSPLEELRQARRILKPGGLIAIRLHNVIFHASTRRTLEKLGNIDKRFDLKPTVFHLYNFSPETARGILRRAGFEDIKITVSGSTSGDPCSTGGALGESGVRIAKTFIDFASKIVCGLTLRRFIISPAMLIFAKNPSR